MTRGLAVRGALVIAGVLMVTLASLVPPERRPTNIGLGFLLLVGWTAVGVGVLLVLVYLVQMRRGVERVRPPSSGLPPVRSPGVSREAAEQRIARRFGSAAPWTDGSSNGAAPAHRNGPVVFTVFLGSFVALVGLMSLIGSGGVFSTVMLAVGLFLIVAGFANGRNLRSR